MKNKILSIFFVLFIVLFFFLNIFIKDKQISKTERRNLKEFPKITISNIIKGKFMEDFDEYTTDHFILRDTFRNIKARVNYNIFNKLDNNKIYVVDNHIFKSEYPTNKKSIDNFIDRINHIKNYLSENNKVYEIKGLNLNMSKLENYKNIKLESDGEFLINDKHYIIYIKEYQK